MELKAPNSGFKNAVLLMAKIGDGSGVSVTWITCQRPELRPDLSLKFLPVKLDCMQATWTSLKGKCFISGGHDRKHCHDR